MAEEVDRNYGIEVDGLPDGGMDMPNEEVSKGFNMRLMIG